MCPFRFGLRFSGGRGVVLGVWCFGVFIGVPHIYGAFILYLFFTDLCSSCAEISYLYILYLPFKKKKKLIYLEKKERSKVE
jgi:hypothetical protein